MPIEETELNEELQLASGELKGNLVNWAMSFASPEALAKRAASWLVEKYPDLVDYATWVRVDIEKKSLDDSFKDTGIQLKIYTKKVQIGKLTSLKISLGSLIGLQSAGLNISAPIYETEGGTMVSVGVGMVTRYHNFGKDWEPVVSVAAKIPLDIF